MTAAFTKLKAPGGARGAGSKHPTSWVSAAPGVAANLRGVRRRQRHQPRQPGRQPGTQEGGGRGPGSAELKHTALYLRSPLNICDDYRSGWKAWGPSAQSRTRLGFALETTVIFNKIVKIVQMAWVETGSWGVGDGSRF